MANNIAIQISANTQQAVAGIQSVNQKLDQMQKTTETATSKFIRISAVVQSGLLVFGKVQAAFQQTAAAVSACVTAYSAQEQAERRLQTVLTATGNAVGMSASELYGLADALSEVTAYSDQEIIAVEQMLIATRKIGSDIMPEATKACLDLAAAIGDDARGAAHDLAQALADPAGEIESLKEKGIQLSEEQKKNIQRVQEQNGVYEAQKILLEEVSKTYGGMAEAIADTDTGKLQQIKNVWEDIKEGLGEGLMNSLEPALDWIYEKLNDISGWIDEQNHTHDVRSTADEYRSSGHTDLTTASGEVLSEIIKNSDYGAWLKEYTASYPDALDSDIWEAAYRLVGTRFSQEDMYSYIAAQRESEARLRLGGLQSLWTTQDIIRNDLGFKTGVATPWQDVISGSVSAYSTGNLNSAQRYSADYQKGATAAETSRNNVAGFIANNSALSVSAQIEAINDKIRESSKLMLEVDPDSDAYKQLSEINDALWEQKEALLETEEATTSWTESWASAKDVIEEVSSGVFSLFDNSVSFIEQLADNAANKLTELQDKWDEYFEDLDEKQNHQRDSLNAMLASGNISYEEYIDAMNDLDESRAEAEEERMEEEEDARAKANELGKAAFVAEQANQIAQATMNAAMSITDIWATHGANPALAGVLTALSAAATGAQIATIAAQQYTPMAAGGIVTSPTHALIGEGGSPEAILPLNEGNMDRFGFGGSEGSGVINISINIGTVYSQEQLADEIFKGIERAQRTGALPKWRYA